MANPKNRPDEDRPLFDEEPRGIADNEDFEEAEDLDDEDLEDEDPDDPQGSEDLPHGEEEVPSTGERGSTGEVGSEGGSRGDIEVGRTNRPGSLKGSEATTIADTHDEVAFRDRQKGPRY